MLTEQQVRTKIKACKKLIKNCKANLTFDRMHDQMRNIFVIEILKHQKLRLKYLRRELPMLLNQMGTNRNYGPGCGQRIKTRFKHDN